jgi:hypothetical protein
MRAGDLNPRVQFVVARTKRAEVITMIYRIQKDDDGNEALYMNAIVKGGVVDLDWVRPDDDVESYFQRGMKKIKALTNGDMTSLPQQFAFIMMRLYRRGDVFVSRVTCGSEYRDHAIKLAKEAALQIYDDVFPEVAQHAQAFVEEQIDNVKRFATSDPMLLAKAGAGEKVASDQYLTYLLNEFKTELRKTGAVAQRVGWLVAGAMALLPITPPPEKYRYFRAVAEVARKVNAEAVVFVTDGYQLTPDGQRTGDEILSVMWVTADASCTTTAVAYTRRKHPHLGKDIIALSPDIPTHQSTQSLIPAWGSYLPN